MEETDLRLVRALVPAGRVDLTPGDRPHRGRLPRRDLAVLLAQLDALVEGTTQARERTSPPSQPSA